MKPQQLTGVVLAALMMLTAAAPMEAGQLSPQEQARKIRPGSKIEVTLLTGQKLQGRLGKVSDTEFDLLPRDAGATITRAVPFAEVQRVHSKERRTGTRVVIYSAATFGVLMVLGGILTAAGCC